MIEKQIHTSDNALLGRKDVLFRIMLFCIFNAFLHFIFNIWRTFDLAHDGAEKFQSADFQEQVEKVGLFYFVPTCAGRGESFGACATRLYRAGGVGIFWEGIGPKVLRAIVNHATTFYVFDLVCARALVG